MIKIFMRIPECAEIFYFFIFSQIKNFKQMKIVSILIIILLGVNTLAFNQDEEITPLYFEILTWKMNDETRNLIVKITTDGEDDDIPVQGIPISYFYLTDEDEVELGLAESNENGIAKLDLPKEQSYYKDDDGYISFVARFDGNDKYEYAEGDVMVKDVRIEFAFELVDSVKTIVYNGVIVGKDDEEMPLADDDIYFYVPRMFSDLKIADGWFEEDGTGTVEFPDNIIGDSLGVLTVIAKIEEHFDYGNVEKRVNIDWGVPKHPIPEEHPYRELWTPVAPLWMIVTLIIMLVGVWGHYFYAMYQLYMINKSSKKSS